MYLQTYISPSGPSPQTWSWVINFFCLLWATGLVGFNWNLLHNLFHFDNGMQYMPRVQRKSFLQLAIRASWSQHLLAQTSFQLAPKAFWRAELISQFFCYSNSSKNITCPSGKLKTEFTSPIEKSTSPGLSDTITSFARCIHVHFS